MLPPLIARSAGFAPCPGFCFEYEESDLTPSGVATLCEKAEHALRTTRSRQSASFKRWKVRLRHSALHSGKEVFQQLRRATSAAGSNHLAGPDGFPAFHPTAALTHSADQWNLIFGVHQAGIPVEPLMRPIQNLLEQRAVTLDLGALSVPRTSWHPSLAGALTRPLGHSRPFHSRSSGSSPSSSIKLRHRVGTCPGSSVRPGLLFSIRVPAHRLPCVDLCSLPCACRLAEEGPPSAVVGGVPGRRADDITHHLALDLHEAKATGELFAGIQIDRSKCFDRLLPSHCGHPLCARVPPFRCCGLVLQLQGFFSLSLLAWLHPSHST